MNKSMVLQSEYIEKLLGSIYPDSIRAAAYKNSCEDYYCLYCNCEEPKMASVPQSAFAAKKIRQNEDRTKALGNVIPMNYSSKYMNSIWGQYNRYSVHNLKKIMDENSYSLFDRHNKYALFFGHSSFPLHHFVFT